MVASAEKTVQYDGDNAVAFVLSENLHRRHLSPGQQAAIVACAQDWAVAASAGQNQHAGRSVHLNRPPVTLAKRAAMAGIGQMTQRRADTVAKASPELAVQDWANAAAKGGNGSNQYKKEQIGREEQFAQVTLADRAAKSGASPSTQRRAEHSDSARYA